MTQGELFSDAPRTAPAVATIEHPDRVAARGRLLHRWCVESFPFGWRSKTRWKWLAVWVSERTGETYQAAQKRRDRLQERWEAYGKRYGEPRPDERELFHCITFCRGRVSVHVDLPVHPDAVTPAVVNDAATGLAFVLDVEAPAVAAWLTTGEVRS